MYFSDQDFQFSPGSIVRSGHSGHGHKVERTLETDMLLRLLHRNFSTVERCSFQSICCWYSFHSYWPCYSIISGLHIVLVAFNCAKIFGCDPMLNSLLLQNYKASAEYKLQFPKKVACKMQSLWAIIVIFSLHGITILETHCSLFVLFILRTTDRIGQKGRENYRVFSIYKH